MRVFVTGSTGWIGSASSPLRPAPGTSVAPEDAEEHFGFFGRTMTGSGAHTAI